MPRLATRFTSADSPRRPSPPADSQSRPTVNEVRLRRNAARFCRTASGIRTVPAAISRAARQVGLMARAGK